MPVYQVDIEKTALNPASQQVYWTNVYHVSAPDQATAVSQGSSIVTIEKTIHSTLITYTKMRVRNVSVLGMAPTIVPLTGTGGRATATDYLPMYCCCRVDFGKATGRPNRKYLRIFILEGDQVNGNLTAAAEGSFQTNYATPILSLGYVCDADGTLISSADVITQVQMRQLRRGSKRRTTPVI
jgi:hypothetical protein